MNKAITLEVIGDQQLRCDGCAQRVERALKGQPGVQKVRANARNQRVEVLFDATTLNADTIAEHIGKVGYQTRVINPSRTTGYRKQGAPGMDSFALPLPGRDLSPKNLQSPLDLGLDSKV